MLSVQKMILACFLLLSIVACKKDKTNIDKVVGKWTVSRYTDSGMLIQKYYLEIIKEGDNLSGTFTECEECMAQTYFVSRINFNKDAITFSYELLNGYIDVNANLKDDTALEGNWSTSSGSFGDWEAVK